MTADDEAKAAKVRGQAKLRMRRYRQRLRAGRRLVELEPDVADEFESSEEMIETIHRLLRQHLFGA